MTIIDYAKKRIEDILFELDDDDAAVVVSMLAKDYDIIEEQENY